MLLSLLLRGVEVFGTYTDVDVLDVKTDSHDTLEGCAYLCIKGGKADGHEFAAAALGNGAVVIICEHDLNFPSQVVVADARLSYAIICKNLFDSACDKLSLIATTGTNGKTSVTMIIYEILHISKVRTGIISTIMAEFEGDETLLDNTTPDSHVLHELFNKMQSQGCETVCMEASSHALDQNRLAGCLFDTVVFTNLTQDHLDYHNSMEDYFNAKQKLFSMGKFAVINLDDQYGKRLISDLSIPYFTYSIDDSSADFYALNIICTSEGVSFTLCHNELQAKVNFLIPGIYSVQNALAGIAVATHMGVSLKVIIKALEQMHGIRGRSEVLSLGKDISVICDFAHTPDGLTNILKSTRQYANGRIVLVFGCGGDRDKAKRALMGEVSAEYADFTVVTSDNPRTEKPTSIINDIIRGIPPGTNYIAIENRSDAIRYAILTAKKGDTIILAGKGHELYQVLGDKKLYYDERKVVKGSIEKRLFAGQQK